MEKFAAKIGAFLRLLFGEFHWNLPPWLSSVTHRISRSSVGDRSRRIRSWSRANLKRATIYGVCSLGVLCGLIIAGVEFKAEWEARPKPSYVTIHAMAPAPRDPEQPKANPLQVQFSASVAQTADLNHDLSGIQMSPKVPGVWRWQSDSILLFTPTESNPASKFHWTPGLPYQVDFPRKLLADHQVFESLRTTFTPPALSLSLQNERFYIDPQQPKIKKVVATISYNYPIDTEDFKKHIEFSFQAKNAAILKKPATRVPFKVSFDEHKYRAFLESEPFDLPGDDHLMRVTLALGVHSSVGGEPTTKASSAVVNVPGRYSAFKISSSIVFPRNEKFEPEQALIINSGTEARSEDIQKSLEVLLLPENHNPPGAHAMVKSYHWNSPGELTPEVRALSQPVTLTLIPNENTWSKTHSFKIDVPVNRSLYIHVKKGVKGLGDYELGQDSEHVLRVPDFQREILFMSKGALLSLSGDKKLPLLARNIEEANFQVGRVIPGQVNHVLSKMMQSGQYARPSIDDIKDSVLEVFNSKQALQYKSHAETVYFSLDLQSYLKENRGLFYVRVAGKGNYPADERLILVTDLGIITKRAVSGATTVFVQDLRTGSPVSGAAVDVVGQNGISVLTLTTGANGSAVVPDLKGFKNERNPIAITARRGNDSAYLPFGMYEREISLSRFDVSGLQETSESDRLHAMIFSDRGIYRPGDSANLGLIVRAKAGGKALPDLPLLYTVVDPRGTVVKSERIQARPFGIKELQFKTQETSPTGAYEARIAVIRKANQQEVFDQLGSLTFKVEEFVPDQLRIQASLDPFHAPGWVPLQKMKAAISLRNLFGSPAQDRVARAQLELVPVVPTVSAFKDYLFANPNKRDAHTITETLTEMRTNNQGEAGWEIDLSKYDGYFQVRFSAEGFQAEGGRGVTSVATVSASTFKSLLGYKADGDLHYINRDAARSVRFVAIDPNQKPTTADHLTLTLVEKKFVSSLMRQDDGTYRYQSVQKDQDLKEEPFAVAREGTPLKLPSNAPGEFAFVVRDAEHRELNRVEFSIVGAANLTRTLDRNAELKIVLNKPDYRPGDEIELQIRSPYAGSGLITIERDDVYATQWFKTSTTNSVEHIRIPEGLEGNAYVSVSFLRAIDSKEIFMSPMSYGVVPFSISLDEHRTHLTLNAPERVKPGQDLKIRYTSDRPTQIVLYGVDEGILQVAKYQMPDPLHYFFQKRALQVQTYQILDLLMPEFSIVQQLSGVGGDEGTGALGKNLNPFRRRDQPPVVFWSGVLTADGTSRTFTYHVPDYFNGSLKLMAVASSEKGLGAVQLGTLSRGDFIITPTTPLFVAPGDEFTVGVSISNQSEGTGAPSKVTLAMKPSAQLSAVGEARLEVDVAPGHEKAVDFHLKALAKPGAASIQFSASGAGRSARLPATLSVRPALPYLTTVKMGLADRTPINLAIDRKRIEEYRKTFVDASVVPLSVGRGMASFLDDYPYGCTEQLISKAVPSLVFRGRPEFTYTPAKAAQYHLDTVAMLRTRVASNGGFSLYGGDASADVPASLYAAQYLTEAADRGYGMPPDMHSRMMAYLRGSEIRQVGSLGEARLLAESVYLQARNQIVASNELNFLVEALDKNFKGQWESDLTAVWLAGTYALLKQDAKGDSLMAGLKMDQVTPPEYSYFLDGVARDAILLQIAAKHYPARLKDLVSAKSMTGLMGPLGEGRYNSYSAAQVIFALDGVLQAAAKDRVPLDVKMMETVAGKAQALSFPQGLVAHATPSATATAVQLTGPDKYPLFYSLTQSGYEAELPAKETKQGLEIGRAYLDKNGSPVDKVKLGEEIKVAIRVRSLKQSFDHLVMVDLFPSGFELVAQAQGSSPSVGESEPEPESEDAKPDPDEEGASNFPALFPSLLSRAVAAEPAIESFTPAYADFREDRVVLYGNASENLQEFVYTLKAVNRGKFIVPPAFGESMYDRSILYRGVAGHIEVE